MNTHHHVLYIFRSINGDVHTGRRVRKNFIKLNLSEGMGRNEGQMPEGVLGV